MLHKALHSTRLGMTCQLSSAAQQRSAVDSDPNRERPVSGAFKGRSLSGALRRKLTKNSRAIAAQVHCRFFTPLRL